MSNKEPIATYRILDASANRAGEGLRTLEEFSRFLLDDAELTTGLKSLRHNLASALSSFSRTDLLQARDTEADVGTSIQLATEYQRESLASVIAAAATRTQQSLRVLEEYGKTIDPHAAAMLEQIRYRCYTISAKLELMVQSSERNTRLGKSQLYVLVDAGESEEKFKEFVTTIVAAGADILQLRDRSVDDRTLLKRARLGTSITRKAGKLFIMNDRPDLALAAETDGVHVGQDEMPVAETRRIVGDRLIGVSTHSIEQARDAVRDGADYIGCGPVFAGRTKTFDDYVGPSFLKQVADEIMLPAFAIGGIDSSNVSEVTNAGMQRIAVTGAVRDADDPSEAIGKLRQQLGKLTI